LEPPALPVSAELKSIGHSLSFHSGISAVMAKRQSCARILMYHGTPSASADALAAQLRYLVRHFKIVPLESVLRQPGDGKWSGSNEIVLTFDDGLRNNLTVVYPILRELKAPATFFVCPGLIESGKWLWNHEVRCRLQTLPEQPLRELSRQLQTIGNTIEEIVEWMKTLDLPKRQRAEEVVRSATPGFTPTDAQRERYDIMTWKELCTLDPGLITIGSHTLSHPILAQLTVDEIEFELRESRRLLEQRLNRAVEYFCYPNGSYDARVYQAVKRIYRGAVTTESGVVGRSDNTDPHRLPRIPSAESAALTAWRLHRPEA
jgi:peptidoglycan/xylan/chitin deacetylase (PgdA/CDA1 family)